MKFARDEAVSSWTPILCSTSDTAERAWNAVNAISDAILKQDYPQIGSRGREHRTYEDPLLFGYLALACKDSVWIRHATERLNEAIDGAADLRWNIGLHGGLCGLGWTIEHLSQVLEMPSDSKDFSETAVSEPGSYEDDDLNADIDAVVLRDLQRREWRGRYELIGGLVGVGIYFLERIPAEVPAQGVKLIIDRLEALSEESGTGITWRSGPESLPKWQRDGCPDGYYNLGVAHGIPAVIHFLSEVSVTGLDDRAGCLLDRAMQWFLAQKRPTGSPSWFSSWLGPGGSSDSRLTWCYGDLGIVAVLLQVARRTGRKDWQEFAHELLAHCLAWPPERSGIKDAPLCHGAVGVAHIFNRIFQSEGDTRCRDLAIDWFERTLAMRQSGTGVGGFLALTKPDPTGPVVWERSPAFVDGAIGIALALLSALTPTEPCWDRMLLVSGRHWNEKLG
jgi:hypothetical protein